MPQEKARQSSRYKSTTSINFDIRVLDFLDSLRENSALFRHRSRSEVVNIIIEEYASEHGMPFHNERDEGGRYSA